MVRPFHQFTVVPSLPPRLEPLRELAFNLWWSWNLDAVDLFRRLGRDLWEENDHNPVLILGKISQDKLTEAAHDEGFVSHMMRVYQAFNRYMSRADTWFNKQDTAQYKNAQIAYFSAEFGLTECLPVYSGGLGVLAGDHLKSASDLGLPLVGVGLLYQQGYFRQYLNADGWQQESYPVNNFETMPIELVLGSDGQPVSIQVEYPGRQVVAQVRKVQVGRVPLYLLDTNLMVNRPEDRDITDQLYGGDLDMRIQQEIMLGIGGLRALEAVGICPTVCHMNEGHSAFLALERIRQAMEEGGLSFEEARALTSAGNVFTTHTPVPAGIDLFPQHLMDHYFTSYRQKLGLSRDVFMALGQPPQRPADNSFSMAVLAIRLANKTNAVSELHGHVARDMWQNLFPGTPVEEVPIGHVTNGIHIASWISQDISSLYLRYLGPRWEEAPDEPEIWDHVARIPHEELWRTHQRRRERLVSVARERMRKQLQSRGATPREITIASEVLNPEVLTIGFARRFATYKRATLLFSDPDRLARILNDPQRPVQIIFAGKAHPRDNPGKDFIRRIVHFARRDDMRRRVIFLEDYEMSLARYMVEGVDVWLNTPRRGMEASGTSGMKAAANGVLNLSTFDGWWCEGYAADRGWRIGHGETYQDEQYGDQVEAQALYDLLEKEIIPLFYDRGPDGLPRNWIDKMKNSITGIAPVFNTHRMVHDYTTKLYGPTAIKYTVMSSDNASRAKDMTLWMNHLKSHWSKVRIVSVSADVADRLSVRQEIQVQASLDLGELTPEDVAVQIYHGDVTPEGEIANARVVRMTVSDEPKTDGATSYQGTFYCASTGLHGYTIRVMPDHENLNLTQVPGLVLWSN